MQEKSRREDEVRSARERLITQGLVRASVPASLVAQEIEQSWRRSVSHRVDPGAGPHILGEIDPDSAILRAAGRILDQWQTNLTDSRMTLFLADEDGRIVSRRIVDTQDERTLDQANAVEGFDFSEQALGTNGLGTPSRHAGSYSFAARSISTMPSPNWPARALRSSTPSPGGSWVHSPSPPTSTSPAR
ncbi:hypothetical protein FXW78_14235 [Rhodococcus opacus]|nr:hypothetical protein [Rhodococcus opacus]